MGVIPLETNGRADGNQKQASFIEVIRSTHGHPFQTTRIKLQLGPFYLMRHLPLSHVIRTMQMAARNRFS